MGKYKSNKPNLFDNLVYGRMPVIELLNSKAPIDKILISNGTFKGNITKIIDLAKAKNIPIKFVSKEKLNAISQNANHQSVIAFISAYEYSDIDDILSLAKTKNQKLFIMILDEIEDPHNMGAIIRTAEIVGVHGIIIPKRRNVGLTPVVMKASAGAVKNIPIVRVSNLVNVINKLKDIGVWIYCLDVAGESWINFDYTGPLAVVIGSEGKGVSRLIKQNSDFIVSLPIYGKINSLNASVAAGVFMYEVIRQRL